MGKEYIPLFLDFNETTQDLSDEECGRLIRAIVDYANAEDYEQRLTGAEKIAFRFLKGLVDRNTAISEARSKAGATRNKTEQTGSDSDQTETNENKPEQNTTNFLTKTKTETKTKTKNQNKDNEARFDRFWAAYPRKEAKPRAKSEFDKLSPDEVLLERMLSAIAKWKGSAQWQEDGGKYIPHPATWIHQKRWEDEPPKKSGQQYEQRDYSTDEDDTARLMAILQGDMRA
ncbi:MAG: hypothetical protein J6Q65_04250 [Lentisphaeria bacterium]|nr:hypothetical protein [Lentisphaeria bacterium]